MADDAVLQAIKALDEKFGKMDEKVDALNVQGAVIVERVGNLKAVVDAHLKSDDETHAAQGKRIENLEHWKTSLVAKIGSVAAAVAVVVSVIAATVTAFVKDAIAGN